jgi:hypothetical protein
LPEGEDALGKVIGLNFDVVQADGEEDCPKDVTVIGVVESANGSIRAQPSVYWIMVCRMSC